MDRGRRTFALGRACLLAAAIGSGWTAPAAAQLMVQGFLGNSFSVPSPLKLVQSGYPDLTFTAHYSTRPFEPTWYYAWRLGYFWGRTGLLLDFVHHKVYLENPPPEVQDFRITYGYNIFTLGPAWKTRHTVYNLGVGAVVGNPHSIVRGQEWTRHGGIFNGGYYLAGPALQGGASWSFRVVNRFFLSLDGRLTAAYARVPIEGGHANVPNLALHVLLGAGYGF